MALDFNDLEVLADTVNPENYAYTPISQHLPTWIEQKKPRGAGKIFQLSSNPTTGQQSKRLVVEVALPPGAMINYATIRLLRDKGKTELSCISLACFYLSGSETATEACDPACDPTRPNALHIHGASFITDETVTRFYIVFSLPDKVMNYCDVEAIRKKPRKPGVKPNYTATLWLEISLQYHLALQQETSAAFFKVSFGAYKQSKKWTQLQLFFSSIRALFAHGGGTPAALSFARQARLLSALRLLFRALPNYSVGYLIDELHDQWGPDISHWLPWQRRSYQAIRFVATPALAMGVVATSPLAALAAIPGAAGCAVFKNRKMLYEYASTAASTTCQTVRNFGQRLAFWRSAARSAAHERARATVRSAELH